MKATFSNNTERDAIVAAIYEIRAGFPDSFIQEKEEERDRILDNWTNLRKEYFERLPQVPLGVCPFCAEVIRSRFDPYGLDGPWWHRPENIMAERGAEFRQPKTWWSRLFSKPPSKDPYSCPHYFLLAGALNFKKRPVVGSRFDEIYVGPDVPYLIRKEIEPAGRMALISSLPMETGYVAYPILYFSEEPRQFGHFSAGWKDKEDHSYFEDGRFEWNMMSTHWEYDLLPTLQSGKLQWCDPDSGNLHISKNPINACPFLNLPGRRKPMQVHYGKLRHGAW